MTASSPVCKQMPREALDQNAETEFAGRKEEDRFITFPR